jgi:hypothetical protein
MEGMAVFGLILAVVPVAIGLARFAVAWRNWRSFARGEDARIEEFVTRIARKEEEHRALTDGFEAVERDRIGLAVELSRRALALHIETHPADTASGARCCRICHERLYAHHSAVREFLIRTGKEPSKDRYFRLIFAAAFGNGDVKAILAVPQR